MSVVLKKGSAEIFQSMARKQIVPIGLIGILGLGGVSWLTTALVAPQSAQAYTARVNVALAPDTNESFPSFLRRAEAVARAAAQRSFDRDILVTDVAVTVLGQSNGAIVPLLSLEVSRQGWRRSPDPQRWITYFPNSDRLLGFGKTPEGSQAQPGATPSPGTTPPPQAPTSPSLQPPGGNPQFPPASPQAVPSSQPVAPTQQTSPSAAPGTSTPLPPPPTP